MTVLFSLMDSSTALDTSIDKLHSGCWTSDYEMEQTIRSLEEVFDVYVNVDTYVI